MIIDMHTHFIPRGFYEAAKKGKDWYGCTLVKGHVDDGSGGISNEHMIISGVTYPIFKGEAELSDPEERSRKRKLDEDIDIQALMVIGYLWNYHLDTKKGSAFSLEVNRELADLQNSYPSQYVGMGVLTMQDTRQAIKEIDYLVKDLGIRSVALATSVNGKNLDDPTIMPILEEAARAGLFLNFHVPSLGIVGSDYALDRFPRYYFRNSLGIPVETTLSIASIIYGGLLDKFPDAKISFRNAGGFMPYGSGRFDHHYNTREDSKAMDHPPSTYLKYIYYDCLIHDSLSLKYLVDKVGADHLMLGTDYPALDGMPNGTVRWIRNQSFLSDNEKAKILGGNAARLLGLLI
jgi:aminocarboxymuconate-semialdehyde decarboxylase